MADTGAFPRAIAKLPGPAAPHPAALHPAAPGSAAPASRPSISRSCAASVRASRLVSDKWRLGQVQREHPGLLLEPLIAG